jgi:phosphatidylglycerol:prolipoprotein diacylglycerol transferase
VSVHPLPLYGAAYATAIFVLLWPQGRRGVYGKHPMGYIFASVLCMTGVCRFLTEFVSRNIKVALGLTEAQLVSLGMILFGAIFFSALRIRVNTVGRLAAPSPRAQTG